MSYAGLRHLVHSRHIYRAVYNPGGRVWENLSDRLAECNVKGTVNEGR